MNSIYQYTSQIAGAVVTLVGLGILYRFFRKFTRQLVNHWSQYLGGVQFSTKEFYQRMQIELLQYGVEKLAITDVLHKQGGIFSSSRAYLRITWGEFSFDLFFGNFGKADCFVSWWLWRMPSGLEAIFAFVPILGKWLNLFFFPQTYYKIDSANAFMMFVQSKVLNILDEVMKAQNVTVLPEHERYPMKRSLKLSA